MENRDEIKQLIREVMDEVIAEAKEQVQEQEEASGSYIPGSQMIGKAGQIAGATVGGIFDLAAGILSMTANTLTGIGNTIRTPQTPQRPNT